MKTNQIRVFHYSACVLGNFHAWRGWNRDGSGKFPSRPAFATFTRIPGPVSRCTSRVIFVIDNEKPGIPSGENFQATSRRIERRVLGARSSLSSSDERELVSPACQRLLRRASTGSISANFLSLFFSLS